MQKTGRQNHGILFRKIAGKIDYRDINTNRTNIRLITNHNKNSNPVKYGT